jgi:predicted dehydrogenase
MTQQSIGIGLIGCGGRLRQVVDNLLRATDRVEVRALHDPNPESIRIGREKYNPAAAVCDDYRALCARPDIDWVMIGSWNCRHREHAVAAFEAGKHVFCEKPLATTREDCLAMGDAWRRSGRLFSIGFTLRYSPHYRRIKEIIAGGELGRILSFEFNETLDFNHGGYIHADWRRKTEWAGSHMLEKCCHDLDIVNWLLDDLPVKAASFGGRDFFTAANAFLVDEIGPRADGTPAFGAMMVGMEGKLLGNIMNPFNDDKDILDHQVALLQYRNGARGMFHTNCMSGIPERRLVLCGDRGALRTDVLAGRIEFRRIGFDAPLEDRSTAASGGHGGGDKVLGASLAETMLAGVPPLTGLEDGLRSAFTAFAIDQAQATGQVVDLTPDWRRAGLWDKEPTR